MSTPKNRTRKVSLVDLSNVPEHPDQAGPERPLCIRCGLDRATDRDGNTCRTPYSRPPDTPGWNGNLVLVGEGPGGEEDRANQYFVGRAGQVLRAELDAAGYVPTDATFLNTVRCRPPNNATPTMEQVRCCRPFLLWELQRLQPRAVLWLGTTATKSLLNDGSAGVTSHRGRLLSVAQTHEAAPVDITLPTPPDNVPPEGSEGPYASN